MASEDVDNRASTGASTTMPAGTDVKSENVHVDHADDIALIEVPSPSSPEPADLLTRTRTDGSAADNRPIYKVYRRRWFGLAQLVLLGRRMLADDRRQALDEIGVKRRDARAQPHQIARHEEWNDTPQFC